MHGGGGGVTGNPLIGATCGDTIRGVCSLLEYSCQSAEDPQIAHPGLAINLQMMLQALRSLEEKLPQDVDSTR